MSTSTRSRRAELLDAPAGAADDGAQRVVGDAHGHAELVAHPLVEAAQQRSPPVSAMPRSTMSPASSGGQTSRVARTSSTICSTGASMARRTSAEQMVTVLGSPVTRSRPRTRVAQLLAQREGRAGADLDVLGAALAEQQGVLALDVGDERLVDLVAADAHGAGGDDAAEADDGDVGRAAADVDDHRRRVSSTGRPAPIAAAIVSSMT